MILLTFFLGNSFIFTLFTWADCTDENIVFRCDSDKNSLVIILYVLKMHFQKYVDVIILFYSILFMWTRCGYQMFLSAPPPVSMTILISFTLALPCPLSHTRCRRGTRGTERSGHVHMVRLAILAVTPPPPSLIRFSLISSPFLLYLQ